MEKTIARTVQLNNGVPMPWFGLGAYAPGQGPAVGHAVSVALRLGYRKIDTARVYANEREVGEAVAQSGLAREDVFITTKVWNDSHGYDNTIRAFNASLAALGGAYVDLYLIHWPAPARLEMWRAMVTLLEEGKCRAIGVSNFTIRHLDELLATTTVVPAVNQVEFSPFLYQTELLQYCQAHGIQLEAYSPLTCGRRLNDPTITTLAQKYQKTPAQIMLRWALQHDVVVIPKSLQEQRIAENAALFDFSISEDDMARMNALGENYRVASPAWYPENWK
jgi:diketogulonate reductase-like aldo/keto reductase